MPRVYMKLNSQMGSRQASPVRRSRLYFSTFKEEYARNKCKEQNVITVSYNNIKLNVSEKEFIDILHQHRKRIDEMIERENKPIEIQQ